jgi:hypothetical protein
MILSKTVTRRKPFGLEVTELLNKFALGIERS